MWVSTVCQVFCVLLIVTPAWSCDTANWWDSLDRAGWSVCPKTNSYIKGFWRNDGSFLGLDDGIHLLEEASCCDASEPSYNGQQAICKYADWTLVLDRQQVWAECPIGYYLNGLYVVGHRLHQIEQAKCCRPQNQPEEYGQCYDEDVTKTFDHKGWSKCNQDGYFMTGFYRSDCDNIYCIEKFRCCKMAANVVDGGLSEYGNWGECSATCGGGSRERKRTCTNPPPQNGGKSCEGVLKETSACNEQECPVDGAWSDWAVWGACSATCGSGQQERTRSCTSPSPSNGGAGCSGNDKQVKDCQSGACSVDGGFSAWSEYGECSKTCGKGKKIRSRTCTSPPPAGDGKDCKGKFTQGKQCKVRSCKKGR